jgi:Dockerin type I domain
MSHFKSISIFTLLLLFTVSVATGSTCLIRQYPGTGPWEAENYTFPNSVCIFPDGSSDISDAVFGNLEISFYFLHEFSWSCNCWFQSTFDEKGILLGGTSSNLVLCGQTEPFLEGCGTAPCGLPQFPIFGGGHSEVDASGNPISSAVVVWGGPESCGSVNVELYFNSPDINGDLAVDLLDITTFIADLNGSYNYRSDFNFDGAIDLLDLSFLQGAMGASCP